MKKICLALIMGWLVNLVPVLSQVESQWRGPDRTGIYAGETLMDNWPEEGPQGLWTAGGLGEGFSSVAVTKDRVYVTGLIKGDGVLFAFDIDGKTLWKSTYGKEWSGSHPGARTTPTVVGNRIYVMSAFGLISCFDKAGKIVWTKDLARRLGAKNLEWGMTKSAPWWTAAPIYCTPGGKDVMAAALNRHDGKTIWTAQGKGGNFRLLFSPADRTRWPETPHHHDSEIGGGNRCGFRRVPLASIPCDGL